MTSNGPRTTPSSSLIAARYRKRPVVIEALQWTGDNQQAIYDFTGGACHFNGDSRTGWDLVIHTLEGHGRATVRDFVIQGVAGEFYACKPDIFEETYERVDE